MIEHIAALAAGRAWLVLARNAVPVVGVYALGWSEGVCLLDYWFDGVSFLAALSAAVVPGVIREVGTMPFGTGRGWRLFFGVVAGALGLGVLGIPFWFSLVFLLQHPAVGTGIWSVIFGDFSVWLGFLAVAVANGVEVWRSGLGSMPEPVMKRWLHWEFNLLLGRVAVMLLLAFVFRRGLVLGLAIALSYLELFPLRALRLLGAPISEDDVPGPRGPGPRV